MLLQRCSIHPKGICVSFVTDSLVTVSSEDLSGKPVFLWCMLNAISSCKLVYSAGSALSNSAVSKLGYNHRVHMLLCVLFSASPSDVLLHLIHRSN